MSCCDGSLLYIDNQVSGRSITVTSVTTDNGTSLRGIAAGTVIASGAAQQGEVYSTGGSNGAAEGQIGISVDGASFTLNYDFKPRNEFGHCPCKAKGSASPNPSGSYKVVTKSTSGENAGCVLNFYVQKTI